MSRDETAGVATLERTQFCTFRVEDIVVGIDVQVVQEVIRAQEMRTVPLAPNEVKGLINLRGQIVTAVDLRH
ncbi:MAG TPA: chemotaxis protein CheW, partial [Acidimicrobiales bacterium]|nr:chemotaxis protein CheW [Acidimicrobiales bacterium]